MLSKNYRYKNNSFIYKLYLDRCNADLGINTSSVVDVFTKKYSDKSLSEIRAKVTKVWSEPHTRNMKTYRNLLTINKL